MIAYNNGGSDTIVKAGYVDVSAPLATPYYEPVGDLNTQTLPAGTWTTDANFDLLSWSRGWFAGGSSGVNDDFIWCDNYSVNLNGLEERFVFPAFDLSNMIHPKFYFYRSYIRRDANTNDTLKVYAKNCGGNDSMVFKKGGAQLANVSGFFPNGFFIPQPFDWVMDSVDLISFAGMPDVTISFANKGYGGQLIFIDEFLLQETNAGTGIQNSISGGVSVFPNPAKEVIHIRSNGVQLKEIFIMDIWGRIIYDSDAQSANESINISSFAKGIYFLHVNGKVYKFEKF